MYGDRRYKRFNPDNGPLHEAFATVNEKTLPTLDRKNAAEPYRHHLNSILSAKPSQTITHIRNLEDEFDEDGRHISCQNLEPLLSDFNYVPVTDDDGHTEFKVSCAKKIKKIKQEHQLEDDARFREEIMALENRLPAIQPTLMAECQIDDEHKKCE